MSLRVGLRVQGCSRFGASRAFGFGVSGFRVFKALGFVTFTGLGLERRGLRVKGGGFRA